MMTVDAQEAAAGDKDALDRILIGVGGSLAIDLAIIAAILGARAAGQAALACITAPAMCKVIIAEAAAKAGDLLDEQGASQATGGLAKANSPAVRTVEDILAPNGVRIGTRTGKDNTIREVKGDLQDAQKLFDELKQGGRLVEKNDKLTRYELPGGEIIQLRTEATRSPGSPATIDVGVPGINITKIKFSP